jgi:predicted nuclease of predicted toxin-antitoxin system
MKFLVDECLSPALVAVAHARGFDAYHVAHRGWEGSKDGQILKRLVDEELTLVTNNRDDFVALVSGIELHPGLVVILDNVRRDDQVALFVAALEAVGAMTSLINKVVEVAADRSVKLYDLPPD